MVFSSQKVCCPVGLLDQNTRAINVMFMCFYLFHFCLASIDKLCVYFFWYQKPVTNSRCDGDQSLMCDAAARASHTSRALALHHWCWCHTVTVITVSFVNAQNEADIRSDTSHNHSCAFVVCSSRKYFNFYKGKYWKQQQQLCSQD